MANATLRVFRVTFYCEECPNEFTDEMLTVSHSWCPCCDMRCEPDGIEEYEECEADDDEPELTELDPDRLREDRDERLACLQEIGGED